MGLTAVGRFDILNEVQVKVFKFVAVLIITIFSIGANLYLSISDQMVGCTFVEKLLI